MPTTQKNLEGYWGTTDNRIKVPAGTEVVEVDNPGLEDQGPEAKLRFDDVMVWVTRTELEAALRDN